MHFNVMLEGQDGLTYADLLAVAQRAESLGFDGMYRSDHYSNGSRRGVSSTDAWATLGGLARETRRISLGPLVTPATFRPIGNLAKMAATVAEMAGPRADGTSRIAVGMGTGWMEVEHRRHGFPFEDIQTRFRRLEEHLDVLSRLWNPSAQPFDFEGEFVTIEAADFAPVPDPRPPIILGGSGMRRTPQLAARFGDELNGVFLSPEQCRRQRAALHDACRATGRDAREVRYSLMTRCLVGRTQDEFEERARRLQQRAGRDEPLRDYVASFEPHWLTGTVDRVGALLKEFSDAGVQQVMLQHLLVDDMDMLDLVAEKFL
ncbi:MAG: LLM class flavin-dependent oxidoreductase [Nitriliruptorales bacterium]|nr:LLM class flavin-dependent oxidoreductase [Nitriliruptorales bacterium]